MRATLLLTLLLLGRPGPVEPSDDDDASPVSLIEEGTMDLGLFTGADYQDDELTSGESFELPLIPTKYQPPELTNG
jgi:hypothetical protein